MERTATWANIGHDFVKGVTNTVEGIPEEMAFKVEKRPMGFLDSWGQFQQVKGTSTVVNLSNGRAYGPVSDNYSAVDNVEALGVLQYIEGMDIVKYGETRSGMQFIIGKLPEVQVLGDSFTPYLCFRNSFNGRYPIQAAICPLRIVCQNQLNLAFRSTENTFNIRHTVKAVERLEEAQHILLGVADYMKELQKEAERYASIKISDTQRALLVSQLFPIKEGMSDRQEATVRAKIAQFQQCLLANDVANFKGTLWSLVQSYSDFHSHEEAKRQTATQAENKFISVTFDSRALMNMIAMAERIAA